MSQFLKAPSPGPDQSGRDLATSSRKEDKSERNERDKHRDRQAAHSEHGRDRDHESTQQRLLALAQYNDQPSNDRDISDSSRQSHRKSTHDSKLKNSRSPGHRRH